MVSGGSSTPAPTATTEFYSLEAGTWEILANFAYPRFGHSMAELNGLPTAIGGFFGDPTAQLVDGEWVDVPDLAILLQKARFALVEVPSDVINCD